MQQMTRESELIHVHTSVRRHPQLGAWAVFAVVKGTLGAHLYVSTQTFVLEEMAWRHMDRVIDDRLDAVLRREAVAESPDVFLAMEAVSELVRQPTQWHPEQFDSLS